MIGQPNEKSEATLLAVCSVDRRPLHRQNTAFFHELSITFRPFLLMKSAYNMSSWLLALLHALRRPSVRVRPRVGLLSSLRLSLSPRPTSIDLSFHRIYRIEGERGEKCAPPAFLFARSANEPQPRLRDTRECAANLYKGALCPRRRPVPFPFFFLFLRCPQ